MKTEFRVNGYVKLLVVAEDETERYLLDRLGQESEKGIMFTLEAQKDGSYLFKPPGE